MPMSETDEITAPRRTISYVLPVYNEEENIGAFHAALIEATSQRGGFDFEFVYVDDGSRDDSLASGRTTTASRSSASRATSATRSPSPPASTPARTRPP